MKERRGAARLDISTDVELDLPGREHPLLGMTINISHSGVYFETSYFMDEGTKLPMIIRLPLDDSGDVWPFTQEGIVVRCEPPMEEPSQESYKVACFFFDIDEENRDKMDAYVHERIADE
ncbi:PilZ domain-containing protein [bacterium]|nr:PilZ domain-containing protein [bacterium]